MGDVEDRLKALESTVTGLHAEIAKLAKFEASVTDTQKEVAKLATFEANVTKVHTEHQEKIDAQFVTANKLVEACRTEFTSLQSRLTNVEGRSRGGDEGGKGNLMGWKDAVLPKVWSGDEVSAEDWFESVMDYAGGEHLN